MDIGCWSPQRCWKRLNGSITVKHLSLVKLGYLNLEQLRSGGKLVNTSQVLDKSLSIPLGFLTGKICVLQGLEWNATPWQGVRPVWFHALMAIGELEKEVSSSLNFCGLCPYYLPNVRIRSGSQILRHLS